jgi:hypothetical protein
MMAQMDGNGCSDDCVKDTNCSPAALVKADSQLAKTGMTSSPSSQLLVHVHASIIPAGANWRIIPPDKQVKPESAFLFLIKKPPLI